MRNRRERLHRAGRDHHRRGRKRAARDRGTDVRRVVGHIGESLERMAVETEFVGGSDIMMEMYQAGELQQALGEKV